MPKRGIIGPAIVILVAILSIAGLIALGISIGEKSVGPMATNPVITIQPSPAPSPAPDVTANWKTYTNTKYGFYFKYPASWGLSSTQNESAQMNVGNGHAGTCNAGETIDIFNVNYGPYQFKSIDDYKKNSPTVGPNAKFEDLSLNGEKAVRASYLGSPQTGGTQVITFLVHNGFGYEIDYRFCNAPGTILNDSQIVNIKPDILATFKFTQ